MKPVVAVIAHPDDEAFGPAGTLAQLAQTREVYLICVTNGEEGQNNSSKKEPLTEIRHNELLESAKVLGIKKVFFLGFQDGTLSNNVYHKVADKIRTILTELEPEIVITNELHGVSGHLDHIAVSFITSYVCQKLSFISEVWYFCLLADRMPRITDYFVYFPKGYSTDQINKTVDISSVWSQKIQAMQKHESQKQDMARVLEVFQTLPLEDHFIVVRQVNL